MEHLRDSKEQVFYHRNTLKFEYKNSKKAEEEMVETNEQTASMRNTMSEFSKTHNSINGSIVFEYYKNNSMASGKESQDISNN